MLTAATIYLILLIIGFTFVVGLAAFDFGDIDFDADADIDGGHGMSPFSPILIAVFLAVFGMLGMTLTLTTTLSVPAVAGISLTGGLPVYFGAWALFEKFFGKTVGALVEETVVGSIGTIGLDVRPNAPGTVTLAVNGRGRVYTATANTLISSGTVVKATGYDGLSRVQVVVA